jgi:hypothetical protein
MATAIAMAAMTRRPGRLTWLTPYGTGPAR